MSEDPIDGSFDPVYVQAVRDLSEGHNSPAVKKVRSDVRAAMKRAGPQDLKQQLAAKGLPENLVSRIIAEESAKAANRKVGIRLVAGGVMMLAVAGLVFQYLQIASSNSAASMGWLQTILRIASWAGQAVALLGIFKVITGK